jgi:hypothetical protein
MMKEAKSAGKSFNPVKITLGDTKPGDQDAEIEFKEERKGKRKLRAKDREDTSAWDTIPEDTAADAEDKQGRTHRCWLMVEPLF